MTLQSLYTIYLSQIFSPQNVIKATISLCMGTRLMVYILLIVLYTFPKLINELYLEMLFFYLKPYKYINQIFSPTLDYFLIYNYLNVLTISSSIFFLNETLKNKKPVSTWVLIMVCIKHDKKHDNHM